MFLNYLSTLIFFNLLKYILSFLDYTHTHGEGETLKIGIGQLKSVITHLPFRPDYPGFFDIKDNKIINDNLGEIISGSKITESNFLVNVNKNEYCKILNTVTLNKKYVERAKWLINHEYTNSFYLDKLPSARGYYDTNSKDYYTVYQGGIPLGFYEEDNNGVEIYYIYNHFTFKVLLHETNTKTDFGKNKYEIVGFITYPSSIVQNENNIDSKIYEERKNGIKVIADQMARKFFNYDEKNTKTARSSKQNIYELVFKNNADKRNLKDETEISNIDAKSKKNSDNIKKINQIPDNIDSNINTYMNTKENQNTLINNTNLNTGTNLNTYSNNNNENEIFSNLNTRRSKNSPIEETINDYENISEKETKRRANSSLEKVNSNILDDNDSLDNENMLTNLSNQKEKNKFKKKTIYERGIQNRIKKENKLEKKRKEKKNKLLKELKAYPHFDRNSLEMAENKGYTPIEERAAKIHSLKIFNNIMNQEKNKILKYKAEMAEIKKYKKNYKKFDKNDWDKFVKRQNKWNKKVQYQLKAAILTRDYEENEIFYKPKINSRSKSIIEEIEEENKDYIDEVYYRLYNDFEERQERQKFRNQISLPSFRPKIIKCSSQKFLEANSKKANRCGTNPLLYLKHKNKTQKSYILNNSMEQKSHELFIDSCNNFTKYINNIHRNEKFNKNYMKFINKSQQTNQQTNNNYSKLNCSQASSGLINSNYIILDNQKLNQKGNTKNNSSAPYLPFNIKKMIEKNCKEEEEKKDIDNINKSSEIHLEKEMYRMNYSLYNMEEQKEKNKNEKYNESKIDILNEDSEKIDDKNINNKSELEQQNEKENIFEEFENSKKNNSKSKNEIINSDESDKSENNFYKIDIRDTTPNLIKENIILASKDYSDFFDVPDLEEDA